MACLPSYFVSVHLESKTQVIFPFFSTTSPFLSRSVPINMYVLLFLIQNKQFPLKSFPLSVGKTWFCLLLVVPFCLYLSPLFTFSAILSRADVHTIQFVESWMRRSSLVVGGKGKMELELHPVGVIRWWRYLRLRRLAERWNRQRSDWRVIRKSSGNYLGDESLFELAGGGASLIPPGGGGNAPGVPVRFDRRDDSLPSFFCKSNHIKIPQNISFSTF